MIRIKYPCKQCILRPRCSVICQNYDDWYQGYPPFKVKRMWFKIRDWRWDTIFLYTLGILHFTWICFLLSHVIGD